MRDQFRGCAYRCVRIFRSRLLSLVHDLVAAVGVIPQVGPEGLLVDPVPREHDVESLHSVVGHVEVLREVLLVPLGQIVISEKRLERPLRNKFAGGLGDDHRDRVLAISPVARGRIEELAVVRRDRRTNEPRPLSRLAVMDIGVAPDRRCHALLLIPTHAAKILRHGRGFHASAQPSSPPP